MAEIKTNETQPKTVESNTPTIKELIEKSVQDSNISKEEASAIFNKFEIKNKHISNDARNQWKELDYEVRINLQKLIGANQDGKIGTETVHKIYEIANGLSDNTIETESNVVATEKVTTSTENPIHIQKKQISDYITKFATEYSKLLGTDSALDLTNFSQKDLDKMVSEFNKIKPLVDKQKDIIGKDLFNKYNECSPKINILSKALKEAYNKIVDLATSPNYTGKGTLNFPENDVNGSKSYVGDFKNGKLEGKGTYTWANGDKYVGEFKNDSVEGTGTLTWANGSKYVGEFKNGLLEGTGTLTWADGSKYVGEFKNGFREGTGTYTNSNKVEFKGTWKENKFTGKVNGKQYTNASLDDLDKITK